MRFAGISACCDSSRVIRFLFGCTGRGCVHLIVSKLRQEVAGHVTFFPHGARGLVGLGLLGEVRLSHSDTPYAVGLLWTSDQPVSDTST